ncbi:MAG: AAA family ATPase [Sulfuricaulis sp.]|nr:AAA family ATPase [Sulfuricaulis sp.]
MGECWSLESTDERHPQYGAQRCVARGSLTRPTGAFLVYLLSRHPALRGLGLGVVTANKLYQAHGSELANLLSRGDAKGLPELAEDIACELCERWSALAFEPSVVTWLDERGLEPRIASRIIALYGVQAVEAMETNPYCLLPFMAFEKIDAFALTRLKLATNDPRRMVAAVEAALYRSMAKGHTASSRTDLIAALRWSFGDHAEEALSLALAQEVAFASGTQVQAYAPALMERELEKWLREVQQPAQTQQEMLLLTAGDTIPALVERQSKADGTTLTDEQRQAVLGALASRIYCILGGAGVGKTTVLKMLARLITAVQGQACFMAISGRATRRIAEALGSELAAQCTVKTVAAYLKSTVPTLAADSAPWLIVDESSMIDLQNAYRIVTRSPALSRLVLVGDPHQLPPVGAGLFFHRLVTSDDVPRTELTRVFRHAEATGIPAVARDVRAGLFPALPPFEAAGHGVQLQETSSEEAIPEAIRIRDLLAQAGDVQILTMFRNSLGASDVNRAMHGRVEPGTPRLVFPLEAALGEPVMFAKNDPELDLQNGSLGIVAAVDENAKVLSVRWDDGVVRDLSGPALYSCDLAHGITTHKSQGSQYERVVIVVPRASKILDRTLLYTAITRAKKQAVLVGDRAAIRAAVIAPSNATQRSVLFLSQDNEGPSFASR